MIAKMRGIFMAAVGLCLPLAGTITMAEEPPPRSLERIRVAGDGFVRGESERPFRIWGVNYDHDEESRLLEEYWEEDWERVAADFREIADLGANTVRIHLQLEAFMDSPETPDAANLERLRKLVALAAETGLYLDLTGLACYRRSAVPQWYDELGEAERWEVQARFWEAVAETCAGRPAVLCYDLMNEPVLPGAGKPETEWLTGELGGFSFVQRLTLELGDRSRPEVARAWVDKLCSAIRKHDREALITVGVIPWAHVFPKAEPLFYSPEVGARLDFVSVHFYPKTDAVDAALTALSVYQVGKPLVIEEMFPLHCSIEDLARFVEESAEQGADGWVSFYWGKSADEYREGTGDLAGAIKASWLEEFRKLGARVKEPPRSSADPRPEAR